MVLETCLHRKYLQGYFEGSWDGKQNMLEIANASPSTGLFKLASLLNIS